MNATKRAFLLWLLLPFISHADDIKTLDGKTYKNVKVVAKDLYSVTVLCDDGGAKISFENLSSDLQKKYGYDPDAIKALAQQEEAKAAKKKADNRRWKEDNSIEYGVVISAITQRGSIMSRKLIVVKKKEDGTYSAENTVEGDYLIGGINFGFYRVGDTRILRLFALGSYAVNGRTFTCFTIDGDAYRQALGHSQWGFDNTVDVYVKELFNGDASINPQ